VLAYLARIAMQCQGGHPSGNVCRYSKLNDKELLQRLLHVCQAEGVAHTPDGLEAVVFTADGDMRQALNNLQVG
jgi:DNA polymerase III delta prime subunit